jgi:hypothetical protein
VSMRGCSSLRQLPDLLAKDWWGSEGVFTRCRVDQTAQ